LCSGTKLGGVSKEHFSDHVNEFVSQASAKGENALCDGYAPFCKHIFLPNFLPGVKVGAVEITDGNHFAIRAYSIDETMKLSKELPDSDPIVRAMAELLGPIMEVATTACLVIVTADPNFPPSSPPESNLVLRMGAVPESSTPSTPESDSPPVLGGSAVTAL
jgi:hypothetical protein